MKPIQIIPIFDEFRSGRGLCLDAITAGGAALALRGTITRETRDFDVIDPELSTEVLLTKMFALCDRGTDLGDCLAMAPTREELTESVAWIVAQDANPEWPAHVEATLADLGRRCGHGI